MGSSEKSNRQQITQTRALGAKARGVKLGRKFKLTPHQRKQALARRERGKKSQPTSHAVTRQSQHYIETPGHDREPSLPHRPQNACSATTDWTCSGIFRAMVPDARMGMHRKQRAHALR